MILDSCRRGNKDSSDVVILSLSGREIKDNVITEGGLRERVSALLFKQLFL